MIRRVNHQNILRVLITKPSYCLTVNPGKAIGINRNTRRLNDTHNQLAAKILTQSTTVQMSKWFGRKKSDGLWTEQVQGKCKGTHSFDWNTSEEESSLENQAWV